MNLRIGIVGWKLGDNSFGSTIPYMEYLTQYGDVHILTPSLEARDDIDLLVLPGGPDLLSSAYGEVPSYYNNDPDVMKEFFFRNTLAKYIELKTPIFGICLGHQQLNVHFGGKLDQNCGHTYSIARDGLAHEIVFEQDYKHLIPKLGYKEPKDVKVNSLHHQGIPLDGLASCFKPIALGPFNIVEAMTHKELPIVSVQWHPEELYDPIAGYFILHLINTISTTEDLVTENVEN